MLFTHRHWIYSGQLDWHTIITYSIGTFVTACFVTRTLRSPGCEWDWA